MDKNKNSGFKLKELKRIIDKYDFKFVLDLQHAYSHDSTMKYARELFNKFKDKIAHVHVSGEAGNIDHILIKDSDNKKEVMGFLKEIIGEISVPIIIEGKYNSSNDLEQEIDFIESEIIE